MKPAIAFFVLMMCSVPMLLATAPKVTPNREDFVGVWIPDKESIPLINPHAAARAIPEMELRARGDFAFVNIPAAWRNAFGQPVAKFGGISGGEWTLIGRIAPYELALKHKDSGASMVLTVEGKKPPYFLLLHVGATPGNPPLRFYRTSGELNPPGRTSAPKVSRDRSSS
jgi:hypothetical protein